jgi:hypothetical protein
MNESSLETPKVSAPRVHFLPLRLRVSAGKFPFVCGSAALCRLFDPKKLVSRFHEEMATASPKYCFCFVRISLDSRTRLLRTQGA